ncbi:MAG: cache domain-containing protein, partial [Bacteriovoracaceae bacterium]|nr:cache domain-containing protein [Bacteriovoracaceae bacterium]
MKNIFTKFYFRTITLLTIVMSMAFGVIQYNHYTDLRGDYLSSVQRISQSLSGKFSFFYHNIQNISLNSSLKELDSKASSSYFDSLIALYPSYDVIVLTDVEGNLVAANNIGSGGESLNWNDGDINLSDSVWFQKVNSKNMSEDYSKKIIGAQALDFEMSDSASMLYGRVKHGMHFSAPVRNSNDEIVGYVSSFVNDDWIGRLLNSASKEAFRNKQNNLEAFLVNENNKVMATANTDRKISPMSELPFKVETANFSKNWNEGNWEQGVSSLKTFVEEPFFIISKFRHHNFLNDLGWSLVARVDKETGFAAMWTNTIWFMASLGFVVFISLLLKAGSQRKFNQALAHTWKNAELSLGNPKEKKAAVRVLKSVYRSLETLKDSSDLDLPRPAVKLELVQERELEDTKARLESSMQEQKLWVKELGREHEKFAV